MCKSPQAVGVSFVVLKQVKNKVAYLGVKKLAFRVYGEFAKTFGKLLLAFHPEKLHCRADVKVLPGIAAWQGRDGRGTTECSRRDRSFAARNPEVICGLRCLFTVQKY